MKKFEFEPGSYSEQCNEFFSADQEWRPTANSLLSRMVTWAQYPNRYWLTQYGNEVQSVLRRTRVEHKMFQLASMSADRTEDGLRNLEFWYAVQNAEVEHEHLMYMNHLVDPRQDNTNARLELKNDMIFVIDNDLCVPNGQELLRMRNALKLGYMDGYEEYPARDPS